ncbi:erv26 superfamily protein [Leucoagaricus gongylophorus]
MGLLYYVSYLAVLVAFAFVTLSLASGLLYVSELIEEHSRPAKQIGQRGIYTVILLHVILYFTDSLPFLQTIFSIICHIVYLQNFSHTWPLISLSSPAFLASCVLVIADHFTWFFHFSHSTHQARYSRGHLGDGSTAPGFIEIASFFGICVWLAPLFLFLSLSANDNALPVSSGSSATSLLSSPSPSTRISLFRSIFSSLLSSKSKSHQDGNGIIASLSQPLSTQFSPPISPRMPLAPPRTPNLPHSPGLLRPTITDIQELQIPAHASNTNFRLHSPPIARRPVHSDGRLGMHRSAQPGQDDEVFH